MGANKAAKKAGRWAKKAPGAIQTGQDAYLEDPIQMALRDLILEYAADPFTYSEERLHPIKEQMYGVAQGGAANKFEEMLHNMSMGPGARSGAAVAGASNIASDLGSRMGTISADMDMRALAQMWPDIQNALAGGGNFLQQQYAWDRDLANAYQGTGSTLAQLAAIPTTGQMVGQGLGNIAGSVLGGWAGSGGGFGSTLNVHEI